MKRTVSMLEGALLDAAVMRAQSVGPTGEVDFIHQTTLDWSPSIQWSDGGPIIERERILLDPNPDSDPLCPWLARVVSSGVYHYGPTPLVAAMRAYVASKFGKEVELP